MRETGQGSLEARCVLSSSASQTFILCEVSEIAPPPRNTGAIFLLLQHFLIPLHQLWTHQHQKDEQKKVVFRIDALETHILLCDRINLESGTKAGRKSLPVHSKQSQNNYN